MTTMQVTPLTWPQVRRGLLTAVFAVLAALGWALGIVVACVRWSIQGLGYAAGWSWAAFLTGWNATKRQRGS